MNGTQGEIGARAAGRTRFFPLRIRRLRQYWYCDDPGVQAEDEKPAAYLPEWVPAITELTPDEIAAHVSRGASTALASSLTFGL